MNYLQKEFYELMKSENSIFDSLQDVSLDGLWYWDIENLENKWMSPKFWLTLGYNPEEMPHQASAWRGIIHPDDFKSAMENFNKHWANPNHIFDQVVRYTHKNTSTVWVRCRGRAIRNKEGKATRMLGANIDITREKEWEERLKNENDILRSTLENFKGVLIFSIDRQYRYLVFNSDFKSATFNAYNTNVMKDKSMLDSITNLADRKRAKSNCDRALEGEAHMTTEVYGDIEQLYFETRYNPIVNDTNEITGVTVMSSNITGRKKSEEQLQAVNEELESFSYSVSHDMRAPLRAVHGYATILLEEYSKKLDADGTKALHSILYNSKRMGELIDDLLAFSRLGRKQLVATEINMTALVKAVKEKESEGNENKIEFNVFELPPAKGDTSLIKQVLINLISNAVKYSKYKPKAIIEIGGHCKGNFVEYYIKDNGAGFDMQYYHKLFGVFQRLHSQEEFEGTGIGLAIVQKIIHRHNGNVWAESIPNEGTSFYFSLPTISS